MYSRDFLCNAVPLHITQGMRFVAIAPRASPHRAPKAGATSHTLETLCVMLKETTVLKINIKG